MLHWLKRPDPQPDLHDHPNDFISIVIRGCYQEEVPKGDGSLARKVREIRFLNLVRAENRHRIVNVATPTITLVLANKVKREWGFWVDGEFVPWRKYEWRK